VAEPILRVTVMLECYDGKQNQETNHTNKGGTFVISHQSDNFYSNTKKISIEPHRQIKSNCIVWLFSYGWRDVGVDAPNANRSAFSATSSADVPSLSWLRKRYVVYNEKTSNQIANLFAAALVAPLPAVDTVASSFTHTHTHTHTHEIRVSLDGKNTTTKD
jgi:hypothetical protein